MIRRTVSRACRGLHRLLPGVTAFLVAACGDPSGPERLIVPTFAFVSDAEGTPALFRYDHGLITRLSSPGNDDREPQSADGRIVFTSMRDGNAEIYVADLDLTNQQRLTNAASADTRPALNPSGTTVAFVSSRSGTPRIWLMDADGANPRPLDTGSPTFVPEDSPAWSPTGDRIAFTSTRTNTSQVFVLRLPTGAAVQLTHESGGGFAPAWSADAATVNYMALTGGARIMRIPVAGGNPRTFAAAEGGVSEIACGPTACLATIGPLDTSGDVVGFSRDGRSRETLVARGANDRQPAILIPR